MNGHKQLLLCIFSSFLLVNSFTSCDARTGAETQPISFDDKWAVCIGINEFQDSSWNLKYANSDAEHFQDYLVQHANFARDHIKILSNHEASRANIDQSFGWLGKVASSEDLALIFIRTRGTYGEVDPQKKNYLAASDTNAKSVARTAIQMENLMEVLTQRIHARTIVLIADADFSDVIIRGQGGHGMPELDLLQAGHSMLVIPSAGTQEICWESDAYRGSVFTHALIDALVTRGTSAELLETAETIREQIKNDVNKIRRHRTQNIETCGLYQREKGALMLAIPAAHPH
jgi:uncharacterized caspase-like protein